jgi:hypothetical protein
MPNLLQRGRLVGEGGEHRRRIVGSAVAQRVGRKGEPSEQDRARVVAHSVLVRRDRPTRTATTPGEYENHPQRRWCRQSSHPRLQEGSDQGTSHQDGADIDGLGPRESGVPGADVGGEGDRGEEDPADMVQPRRPDRCQASRDEAICDQDQGASAHPGHRQGQRRDIGENTFGDQRLNRPQQSGPENQHLSPSHGQFFDPPTQGGLPPDQQGQGDDVPRTDPLPQEDHGAQGDPHHQGLVDEGPVGRGHPGQTFEEEQEGDAAPDDRHHRQSSPVAPCCSREAAAAACRRTQQHEEDCRCPQVLESCVGGRVGDLTPGPHTEPVGEDRDAANQGGDEGQHDPSGSRRRVFGPFQCGSALGHGANRTRTGTGQ